MARVAESHTRAAPRLASPREHAHTLTRTRTRTPQVFGLFVEAAMGVLFCSREVVARLKARGVDARLVEVRSDHWFMLSSEALAAALARELGQKGWPGG